MFNQYVLFCSEKIITTVATHTDTENDCPAWLLLSGLSSCIKMKKADFVFKYWESHADYIHLHTGRMVNCLRVLTSVAGSAPRKTIAEYFKKLAALLENFECPFTMIPVVVSALCHFYENGLHDSSTVGTPVSLYEKLMLVSIRSIVILCINTPSSIIYLINNVLITCLSD